jgi:DNA invertase Pin-like site-specific DNA recombinase
LKKAGCKQVFTDKAGGALIERKGLAEALSHLRENDALVVWKLDRLGRTVRGLVDLVGELEARRVHFQSLTDGINTKTSAGRFFFHVMASLAQMERELLVERTRAGLAAAQKPGRVGGRKRRMTESKIQSGKTLLESGVAPQEVARNLGVSIPTLYRWLPASEHA